MYSLAEDPDEEILGISLTCEAIRRCIRKLCTEEWLQIMVSLGYVR